MAQALKTPGYEHLNFATNGVEFGFGAEAANVRLVTIQLKQWNLDAPPQTVVDVYVSSDADGATPSTATGFSVTTGGGTRLAQYTANRAERVIANDDGVVSMTVTAPGSATTYYINVVLPSGYTVTSDALVFAA